MNTTSRQEAVVEAHQTKTFDSKPERYLKGKKKKKKSLPVNNQMSLLPTISTPK